MGTFIGGKADTCEIKVRSREIRNESNAWKPFR